MTETRETPTTPLVEMPASGWPSHNLWLVKIKTPREVTDKIFAGNDGAEALLVAQQWCLEQPNDLCRVIPGAAPRPLVCAGPDILLWLPEPRLASPEPPPREKPSKTEQQARLGARRPTHE